MEKLRTDIPRDISYCNYKNCNRLCERNLKYHNFRSGEMFSVAMFEEVKGFTEETCEYFMDFDLNNLPPKVIEFVVDNN